MLYQPPEELKNLAEIAPHPIKEPEVTAPRRPRFNKLPKLRHVPYKGRPAQKANLLKLADFLWNDPRPASEGKFDMTHWVKVPDAGVWGNTPDPSEVTKKTYKSCGTAACAVGWTPIALDMSKRELRKFEDWTEFGTEILGLTGHVFNFIASAEWGGGDNTPQGAAARIYYALEHGAPAVYDDGVATTRFAELAII